MGQTEMHFLEGMQTTHDGFWETIRIVWEYLRAHCTFFKCTLMEKE